MKVDWRDNPPSIPQGLVLEDKMYECVSSPCMPSLDVEERVNGLFTRITRHFISERRKLHQDIHRLNKRFRHNRAFGKGGFSDSSECARDLNIRLRRLPISDVQHVLKHLSSDETSTLVEAAASENVIFLACHVLPQIDCILSASHLIQAIENRVDDDSELCFDDISLSTFACKEKWASEAFHTFIRHPNSKTARYCIGLLTPPYLRGLLNEAANFDSLYPIRLVAENMTPHQFHIVWEDLQAGFIEFGCDWIALIKSNPLELAFAATISPEVLEAASSALIQSEFQTDSPRLTETEIGVFMTLLRPHHFHRPKFAEQICIYRFILLLILLSSRSTSLLDLLPRQALFRYQQSDLANELVQLQKSIDQLAQQTNLLTEEAQQALIDKLFTDYFDLFTEVTIALTVLELNGPDILERCQAWLGELLHHHPESTEETVVQLRHLHILIPPIILQLVQEMGLEQSPRYGEWIKQEQELCNSLHDSFLSMQNSLETAVGHLTRIVIENKLEFPPSEKISHLNCTNGAENWK